MTDHYEIAVIGAGPAGLSAAGRAADHDRADQLAQPRHILLESSPLHANTIQRYQKGKHVMDEPGYLDLRSPLEFAAGRREHILQTWEEDIASTGINLRCHTEVTGISGQRGDFKIRCSDGRDITADNVVMSIGTQGNPRRLGVDGDTSAFVQYQLDDPDEYSDEDIVVIGAGDAAIENALALARQNRVVIVNRRDEFSRAKQGNLDAVLTAINNPNVPFSCRYGSSVKALSIAENGEAGSITLSTPQGEETLPCHRIIARLGSIPPRKFVEACGIEFPSEDIESIPELDAHYQSNVPGLYIIGALAGYPLIKQGMNQGYDVIEYIKGNEVKPADHALLALKFALLPYGADVDDVLALYQQRIPMFARMNTLAFRELIMESNIHYGVPDQQQLEELLQQRGELREQRIVDIKSARQQEDQRRAQAGRPAKVRKEIAEPEITLVNAADDFLYRDGDYSNSFFTIVEGQVLLQADGGADTRLGPGQFFGEMSLLSGRPRIGNAQIKGETILIETPRRTMVKLMAANTEVSEGIEAVFLQRTLQQFFAPKVSYSALREIARQVTTSHFNIGDTIYSEGEQGDRLYLIRSGTIALTKSSAHGDIAVGQPQSGEIFGQMALMGDVQRRETAKASVRCEVIEIQRPQFLELLRKSPESVTRLQQDTTAQLKLNAQLEAVPESASVISFLLDRGVGEATNVLIINEQLCVGCDNCEVACAETHGGVSRLDRKAGARFAHINLPIACRHCEKPHCMKECPPNAIHRDPSGEVFIDDSCIGCGNCQSNCPYGVIRMTYPTEKKPGLLDWLFFGRGPGPGEDRNAEPSATAKETGKKAVKCDACVSREAGPACVQSCPTGAAKRINPIQFVEVISVN